MKTAAGIEAERKEGTALIFGRSVKIEQKLEELGDEQPSTIRTAIPLQLKSLNDEERTIEFVGSTNAKDRYGDVIEQNWELGNFIKNPVVPWGHNYSMPPVAMALEVGYINGNLTFTAKFATKEEYEWADTIYKLYKGGYLRAFSVGFIPLEYEGDWMTGYTFTKCELLEVSCVTVPANPEALVLAYKEGVISDSERKGMIGQAQKLIKTLTDSENAAQNEDMETIKAIGELKDVLVEVRDLLLAQKDAPAPEVKNDEPESDKPADEDPAGGAEEDVIKGITPDDLRAAVKGAVQSEMDYKLGKID